MVLSLKHNTIRQSIIGQHCDEMRSGKRSSARVGFADVGRTAHKCISAVRACRDQPRVAAQHGTPGL